MEPLFPFKLSRINNKDTLVIENFSIKSFTIKKLHLHFDPIPSIHAIESLGDLKKYTFTLSHLEVDFSLETIKRIVDNKIFTLDRIATLEDYLIFSGKYLHLDTSMNIAFKCFYYPFMGTKYYFVPNDFFYFSNTILFPYTIFTNIFLPQEKYWETLSSSFLTFDPVHLFLRQVPIPIIIPHSNNIELLVMGSQMKLLFKENWDEESTGRLNIAFLREIKARLAHKEIEEQLLKNDFKGAKHALEDIVTNNQKDLYALERLMFMSLASIDLSQCISLAERVLEIAPESTKALNALALAYFHQRDFEKTLVYTKKLQRIFEESGNHLFTDDINRFLQAMNEVHTEVTDIEAHLPPPYALFEHMIEEKKFESFIQEFITYGKDIEKKFARKLESKFLKKIDATEFVALLKKHGETFFSIFSLSRAFIAKIITSCISAHVYEVIHPYSKRLREMLKSEERFSELLHFLLMEHSFIQEDSRERAQIEYELALNYFVHLGKINEGILHLRKACGLNKEYLDSIHHFKSCAEKNHKSYALLALLQVQKEYETINGNRSSLLLEEARYLLHNEKDETSIDDSIREALILEENNYFTARNLLGRSRESEAHKIVLNVIESMKSVKQAIRSDVYFDAALSEGEKGNSDEVIMILDKLLAFDEDHVLALIYKVDLLSHLGYSEEAQSIFQKLYRLQSKSNYFLSKDELLSRIDPDKMKTDRKEK